MSDVDKMRLAIQIAQAGIAFGQSPFGAVIARGNSVVAQTHNTVLLDLDPTAHAEIDCIRRASSALKTIDLSGCTLYSTCEPCPMCLSASHWSRIDRVVFGVPMAIAAEAGFNELSIAATDLVQMARSPLRVESGLLRNECAALFDEWKQAGFATPY